VVPPEALGFPRLAQLATYGSRRQEKHLTVLAKLSTFPQRSSQQQALWAKNILKILL
jgi:hypothetical protein